MNNKPGPGVPELQALLRHKQDQLQALSASKGSQEELAKLYRDIKEVQYQLVLLRNNILDPSQADARPTVS